MVQSSSGTLVKYGGGGSVGIFAGQNMFDTDSTRSGIMDARSSFVRMLNFIFANTAIVVDRAGSDEDLTLTSPIDEYVVWRQTPGSRLVEAVPPKTEWDEQVFSLEERDALAADPVFLANVMAGQETRVLVNGLGNQDAPQWSVWIASLSNFDPEPTDPLVVANNPQQLFALAKSYDHQVQTFADRDALLVNPALQVGDRVLVDGNTSTAGLWTVWLYLGQNSGDPEADASGFKLVRYQTYATADFWSYADWYGTGYSAANPPVVSYATSGDRDKAENPVPKNIFVKINDGGNGKWVWTAYADGAWNVVARQSGTIALSANLYANGRPIIGLDPISNSDINNFAGRDGGWELRAIMAAVRNGTILTDLEVNQLFFSMIHFVHAQQDQVTWAFKTSFLNVGGYNEALRQDPVQPVDNTQNLLDFIEEVKPYRVKTRTFTQIVTPSLDQANTVVSDFDFPLYYDANAVSYRALSLNNPTDLAIIQSTRPWKDWYDNYQKTGLDPANYDPVTWNPVRHFKLKMFYDRVDNMPVISDEKFYTDGTINSFTTDTDLYSKLVEVYVGGTRLDDDQFSVSNTVVTLDDAPSANSTVHIVGRDNLTAGLQADRIQQFYDPTSTEAAEKNLRRLMGLNFKKNVFDGGTFANNAIIDYAINGTAGPDADEGFNPDDEYFGFADPRHGVDRPEELVVVSIGESLRIKVTDIQNAVSWVISSARPSSDWMSPMEVGDYDALPLEQSVYDVGSVADHTDTPSGMTRQWTIGQYAFTVSGGSLTFTLPVEAAASDRSVSATVTNGSTYTVNPANIYAVGNTVTILARDPDPTSIPDGSNVAITLTGSSALNDGFKTPDGLDRSVQVMRSDAWEFINWNAQAGVLANTVNFGDLTIEVTPVANGIITPPSTEEVPGPHGNRAVVQKPGVVWINGERIEFFDMETLGNGNYLLSQLRRGTHNTRLGTEARVMNTAISDGSTTTYTFPNLTNGNVIPAGIVVSTFEPIRNGDGSTLISDGYTGWAVDSPKYLVADADLSKNYQYSLKAANGALIVNFGAAPTNGARITLAFSKGVYHAANSHVHDGRSIIDIRPDRNLGGETYY